MLSDQEFQSVAAMASLVSCVGRAASNGLLSSTLRDFRITKAELGPAVSRVQRQQIGLGKQDCFLPAFHRRARRLSSVSRKAGAPGEDDETKKRDSSGGGETKFDDTVDEIQKALGKAFGGPLWFAVLLTLLAVFGGGYVYLIYKYADFSDIPILNGSQGLE